MNYIISKEQYLKVKAAWKENQGSPILYNILRGFDPKRGYTKITNPIKLANGMNEWEGFNAARNRLKYTFAEPKKTPWNSDEHYAAQIKNYQNLLKPYGLDYNPELFAKIKEILNEQ